MTKTKTKKRSHKNNLTRLTAKERARAYLKRWGVPDDGGKDQEDDLVHMLGEHARATRARAKRRHAAAVARMLAKGPPR